jgi:hypothetical protein
LRMKFRRDRRPGLPIEPVWLFYPRYWRENLSKQMLWIKLFVRLRRMYLHVKHEAHFNNYSDLALTPVMDDETETRELFQSRGAQSYLSQEQHLDKFRRGPVSPVAHAGAEPALSTPAA